jgi:hypothetical protein
LRSLPSFFGRRWSSVDEFDNRAGAAFFGIDAKYLVEIQKKEIDDLVAHGWNSETLYKMSVEERRFYYHLLIKRLTKDQGEGAPSPPKKQLKK